MPVLKDVACVKCGTVREAFCGMDETVVNAHCAECGDGKPRLHRSEGNGGCGRRYRFNDPPPDPSGYIEAVGVACGKPLIEAIDTPHESRNFIPDRQADGTITYERERFSAHVRDERRRERRDRQRHADGRGPLFLNT